MAELWLKENKVLTFRQEGGAAVSIGKIENPELLPLCLSRECTVEKFNIWLGKRSIPVEREGMDEMKKEFSRYGTDWNISRNKASLSDHYWIRNRTEEWRRVNFFTRRYSPDIGDMAFKPWCMGKKKIDTNSPDLTTNGILKKRWKQNDDMTSYLVKAGSKITHQEPLSEILVSVLLEQLKIIPFVRYDLCVEGVTICSRCENFIGLNTELVPASYIYFLEERDPKISIYSHLLKMCDKFGIVGAREFIDGMIFIDSITGNEDRNLGNIGFIRDINTLKISIAPLFDFGAAYWSSGNINKKIKSKTFGDVEKRIFEKLKKKCDTDKIMKNSKYKRCIECYPGISFSRKEDLISSISKRNNELFMDKDLNISL